MAILYEDKHPICPQHPDRKDQPDGVFLHEPDWSQAKLEPELAYVNAPCRHCGVHGGVSLEAEEFSWPEPEAA
jgi:hypothetical protein